MLAIFHVHTHERNEPGHDCCRLCIHYSTFNHILPICCFNTPFPNSNQGNLHLPVSSLWHLCGISLHQASLIIPARPPLWKMMEFVTWDDDRNPIFMGKCQIDGNQSPPIYIFIGSHYIPTTSRFIRGFPISLLKFLFLSSMSSVPSSASTTQLAPPQTKHMRCFRACGRAAVPLRIPVMGCLTYLTLYNHTVI